MRLRLRKDLFVNTRLELSGCSGPGDLASTSRNLPRDLWQSVLESPPEGRKPTSRQEVTFPAFHLQGCRVLRSPRGRKQGETVLAASQFLISKSLFVLLSRFPRFFFFILKIVVRPPPFHLKKLI